MALRQHEQQWGLLVHLNEIAHSFPRLLAAAFGQFVAAWGIGVYADQAAAAPAPGQPLTKAQAEAQSDWYYRAQAAIALCGSITAIGGIYAAWKGKQAKEATGDVQEMRVNFASVRADIQVVAFLVQRIIEQNYAHISVPTTMSEGSPARMSIPVEPPLSRPGDHADVDHGTGDGPTEPPPAPTGDAKGAL